MRLLSLLREAQLLKAPSRGKPGAADQKQHRLAAVGGFVQRELPALAGGDAARRIEVEEEVVPAFGDQPVAQGRSFGIVQLEWLRKMRAKGNPVAAEAKMSHPEPH